jgi:Flp pilus assembly protein TadD
MAFPKDPEVRRMQAMAADGRGRLREAAEYLKAACEAEYFNPENHFLLGRVYTRAEQFALARKSFENALSWQEDHEGARKALEDLDKLEGRGSPIWKKLFRGRKK